MARMSYDETICLELSIGLCRLASGTAEHPHRIVNTYIYSFGICGAVFVCDRGVWVFGATDDTASVYLSRRIAQPAHTFELGCSYDDGASNLIVVAETSRRVYYGLRRPL